MYKLQMSSTYNNEDMRYESRRQEAEEKIRKMQNAKGQLNLHRVDSEELAEINSIESSKIGKLLFYINWIDYAEKFEEKFEQVDLEIEKTNLRINKLRESVLETEKDLRAQSVKNAQENQQYVSILHNEFDDLVSKKLNETQEYSNTIEQIIKKLTKLSHEVKSNVKQTEIISKTTDMILKNKSEKTEKQSSKDTKSELRQVSSTTMKVHPTYIKSSNQVLPDLSIKVFSYNFIT